jgi:uncharacterized delta-60 repeat protein
LHTFRRFLGVGSTACLLLVAGASAALPHGSLDPSFKSPGGVVAPIRADTDDRGAALAVQTDKKLLAAGATSDGGGSDMLLVRYTAAGALDMSFGDHGAVTTDVDGVDGAAAVAVQKDGKVVVAGFSAQDGFVLARYDSHGVPDTAFGGGDGIATASVSGPTDDHVHALVVQSDGKLVVAGESQVGTDPAFTIVRFDPSGAPDAAFGGGDGVVTTPIGSGAVAQALALQKDGKLVAAGRSTNGTDDDFALVRYDTAGVPDPLFGGGDGIVTTPIGPGDDRAAALVVQGDGKLVVAGTSSNGSDDDFALVRYAKDGSPDAAFGGGDGIVSTPVGSGDDVAAALVLQNGKPLAAGSSSEGPALVRYTTTGGLDPGFGGGGVMASDAFGYEIAALALQGTKPVAAGFSGDGVQDDVALARYTAAGALDRTFTSLAGWALTPIGGFDDRANAVAVQSDRRVVAAGSSYPTASISNIDFAVARYNTNGTLDRRFSGDGMTTTAVGAIDEAFALVVQKDGKLVVAGESDTKFALVRYQRDGSLDTTFDGDGIVTTLIDTSSGSNALVVQPDGKLVAAGWRIDGAGPTEFAVVRYNADGSLDTTFDGDGIATTAVGSGDAAANALIRQADGTLVAAGFASNGTDEDFALVRYNADGSIDGAFGGGDGIVTTPLGSDTDDVRALALQKDGKLVAAGRSGSGFALARYLDDGSLDATLDGDGILTTPGSGFARALVVQKDGKLVAGGSRPVGGGKVERVLVRYLPDGTRDASFGDGGILSTPNGYGGGLSALALQADGRLVGAGSRRRGADQFVVALTRYLP